MKVLRWQEASLESSKGFYRGSRSYLKSVRHPYPEIHEIHQNLWKSRKIDGNLKKTKKIYEIQWKSSDDKKSAWNRAKVSIGAAGPILSAVSIHAPKFRKSSKIYENPWKSMKIYENRWKTMKVLRWQEASLESSKGFYRGSRLSLKAGRALYPEIMKIHQNS